MTKPVAVDKDEKKEVKETTTVAAPVKDPETIAFDGLFYYFKID